MKSLVMAEKKKLREAREARKRAIEEMSQETKDALKNMQFYKFYPVKTDDTPDISDKKVRHFFPSISGHSPRFKEYLSKKSGDQGTALQALLIIADVLLVFILYCCYAGSIHQPVLWESKPSTLGHKFKIGIYYSVECVLSTVAGNCMYP